MHFGQRLGGADNCVIGFKRFLKVQHMRQHRVRLLAPIGIQTGHFVLGICGGQQVGPKRAFPVKFDGHIKGRTAQQTSRFMRHGVFVNGLHRVI